MDGHRLDWRGQGGANKVSASIFFSVEAGGPHSRATHELRRGLRMYKVPIQIKAKGEKQVLLRRNDKVVGSTRLRSIFDHMEVWLGSQRFEGKFLYF